MIGRKEREDTHKERVWLSESRIKKMNVILTSKSLMLFSQCSLRVDYKSIMTDGRQGLDMS